MIRVFHRSVFVSGAVLLIAAAALPAQDRGDVRLGITYTPGYQPGLVVTAVEAEATVADVAAAAEAILRVDLAYADRFEIIPVPDSLATAGAVNYALWNQLGAVWLVSSEMAGTPTAPVLRVSLHDVVFGELKEVQAFFLPASTDRDFRMAVHRVADQIVAWATGEPGIAATRIVFRRKTGDGNSDVFAIDYDGENLTRLTSENSIVFSPVLSPDGRYLLFVSYGEGQPKAYERNLESGRTSLISGVDGLNVTPIYSPDGRKIVLARTVGDHTELFEFGRLPLCCMKRLTYTNAGETLNAAYSPGGDRLAITSSPLGNPQIYVMSASGGAPQLISRYVFGERGYATSPDWSPRGDRIAYQAWVENSFQIVTVNPNGGDRRVMTSAGSNEDPSWGPDGRHLVFASAGRRGNSLLILDTVSGQVRTLTSGHVDQLPDWSTSLR
jgi:TolB protein